MEKQDAVHYTPSCFRHRDSQRESPQLEALR